MPIPPPDKIQTSRPILLALGSNLGNCENNLAMAIHEISNFVEILKISSLYISKPKYETDQPDFHNQVLYGRTGLEKLDLLKHCKATEQNIGRTMSYRNGPRSIDIDIIFYDDSIACYDSLTIPHPKYSERAFVLLPAKEIVPDWVCPQFQQSITQLWDKLPADEKDTIRLKI